MTVVRYSSTLPDFVAIADFSSYLAAASVPIDCVLLPLDIPSKYLPFQPFCIM